MSTRRQRAEFERMIKAREERELARQKLAENVIEESKPKRGRPPKKKKEG